MSEEYWETLVKDLNVKINHLEFVSNEKQEKIEELQARIDKAIEYIKENCIDDEFYVNLTKKEKCIIDVLEILGDKNE